MLGYRSVGIRTMKGYTLHSSRYTESSHDHTYYPSTSPFKLLSLGTNKASNEMKISVSTTNKKPSQTKRTRAQSKPPKLPKGKRTAYLQQSRASKTAIQGVFCLQGRALRLVRKPNGRNEGRNEVEKNRDRTMYSYLAGTGKMTLCRVLLCWETRTAKENR